MKSYYQDETINDNEYLPKLSFVILSFADRLKHERGMGFNSNKPVTGHKADQHLFPVHFLMLLGKNENFTFIILVSRLTSEN